ncbi:hypothetical protein M0R45_021247 [Rubus argutus]|uniref:Uncharacterized protein n=1 Tax=Rubus argutus TaxID=59490 RepID=A0AAW1XCJ8_RUBAR
MPSSLINILAWDFCAEAIRVVTNEGKQVVGPSEFSGYHIQGTNSQPIKPPDPSRIPSTNDKPMPPDQSLIHRTN